MSRNTVITAVLAALVGCVVGASLASSAVDHAGPEGVVAEGVLYRVEYTLDGDRTGGFTRANSSKSVPGGNGSWNIDAYGKLTKEFLIITRPQLRDLGPRFIPVHRLVDVQFGDGGITVVDENKPGP